MSTPASLPDTVEAVQSTLAFPPLARFRFLLQAEDAIRLPEYAGSAWRGLLGHGLRSTACVTRQPSCDGCLLRQNCVYSTLFETPAPEDAAASGYSAMPHPFVLDIDPHLPSRLVPGDQYPLTIHLLGAAIDQAPYLIHALNLAGQRGIGSPRGRFKVAAVHWESAPGNGDWRPIYSERDGAYQRPAYGPLLLPPAPAQARLRLMTPLRLKWQGRFVGAREFSGVDLIRALYRRLRTLGWLQGGDARAFDPRGIEQAVADFSLHSDWLRWYEWTRYSSRQDTLMQFGGLIGECTLHGSTLPELWPALWLGQWTHVGKGTAFGLGGYRIEAVQRDSDNATQACET